MNNFVMEVLKNGGTIKPLIVPSEYTNGSGTFNPTIFNDDGKLVGNIRHCQYTLYHSELQKFEHEYGPLVYVNPENNSSLVTKNYYFECSDDLDIKFTNPVNTSRYDTKPLWSFVGQEDVRVVRWDDRLFYTGVRRDTTADGIGRIELSEIMFDGKNPVEVSRTRIPAPHPNNSYCEKNWMPVVDQPYTFVKWSNPTEVVKYDSVTGATNTVFLGTYSNKPYDYRGGSQVIRWKDYYLCITHVANLYSTESGKKNSDYQHAFILWDKNWNVVKYSDLFKLMSAKIEFACGLCLYKDDLVLTFGFQDNAAFILRIPVNFFERFINV